MNAELLIATNGYKGTWPSIEYGAWLAATLKARVSLLGVTEHLSPAQIDDHHPLEDVFARAIELFQAQGVKYGLEIRNGDAEEIIPHKVKEGDFITVLGPLGRPRFRRWLMGRSIRHLMAEIAGALLYVPQARIPLQKLLICIGGLGYELTAEHFAMQVAVACRAEIVLLHVVPQVDLDYPTARIERKEWQHLVETNTPVGRSLRQTLDIAKTEGLTARVIARQGHVVEEILAEVKEGNYDMLCMGSPYSTNALRQLYTPNVTGEVAEAAGCPVVTARYTRE